VVPMAGLKRSGTNFGLAQRTTTRRGEHQVVAVMRPIGQVGAQFLRQRAGQPDRPRLSGFGHADRPAQQVQTVHLERHELAGPQAGMPDPSRKHSTNQAGI
jgi:hypothetical protein